MAVIEAGKQSSSPEARKLLKRIGKLLSTRPERIANIDLGRPEVDLKKTTRGSDPNRGRGGVHATKKTGRLQGTASRAQRTNDYIEMDIEVPELHRSRMVTGDFVYGGETDESGQAISFTVNTEGARPEVAETVEEVTNALRLHTTIRGITDQGLWLGDSFSELNYLVLPDGTGRLIGMRPLDNALVFPKEVEGWLDHYLLALDGQRDGRILKPFQVLHYAHRRPRGSRFGISQWSSARKRWRLAEAVEDVLAMLTVTSAREKTTFMYPFPDEMDPDDVWEWMRDIQAETEDDWFWDDNSELQKRVVPRLDTASPFLPFYVESSGTRAPPVPFVVKQAAADLRQLIEVLQFFQDSYFIATGVPAALAGFEKNVNAKATLEGQLQGFGLTIRNLQTDAASVLLDLYTRGLLAKGIIPEKGEIIIEMPTPLQFDAKLRAEVIKIRADAAKALVDAGMPLDFVLGLTLEISEGEIEELRPQLAGGVQEAMVRVLSKRFSGLDLKPVKAGINADVPALGHDSRWPSLEHAE